MKVLAETLIGKRRYSVEMNRDKMGLRGFLAVQAVGLAIYLVGTIKVEPSE
jgi:hypothetical protein